MSRPLNDALLHCFKYSGQDVYGLLLSTSGGAPTACAPLFHTPCVSTPMIRTALSIVESLVDHTIVGIYFSTNGASRVSPVARLLHSTISAANQGSDIIIWRYDSDLFNDKSQPGTAVQWPFVSYSNSSQKETISDKQLTGFDVTEVRESIQQGKYATNVFDFEDFMNDPSVEWIKS